MKLGRCVPGRLGIGAVCAVLVAGTMMAVGSTAAEAGTTARTTSPDRSDRGVNAVTFYTIAHLDGSCLSVTGVSEVGTLPCHATGSEPPSQLWRRIATDSGYVQLRNAANDECLDISGASQDPNAIADTHFCNYHYNQQFQFKVVLPPFSGGAQPDVGYSLIYQLVARHSGLCPTVHPIGGTVEQFPCFSGPAIEWAMF